MDNFVLEDCEIYDAAHGAITANTHDASYLYFMHNHIHDIGTYEAFYLGAHSGGTIAHHCTVYNNYVHDLPNYKSDGIEVKDGSYANLVKDNVVINVHDPGIIVYGTRGKEPNIIEGNFIFI